MTACIHRTGCQNKAICDEVGHCTSATRADLDAEKVAADVNANEKNWRCFHCDEVFTSDIDAANHFGRWEGAEPACRIKAPGEFALLQTLRNAEDELNRYRSEDGDVLRAMHSMIADHQVALRREEENGYARGLRDAAAPPSPQSPVATLASNQQVRRLKFGWINGEGDLWDDPDGNLVHYADYVKLEQKLLEAKRQRNDEQRLRFAAERSRVETPTPQSPIALLTSNQWVSPNARFPNRGEPVLCAWKRGDSWRYGVAKFTSKRWLDVIPETVNEEYVPPNYWQTLVSPDSPVETTTPQFPASRYHLQWKNGLPYLNGVLVGYDALVVLLRCACAKHEEREP